MANQNPEELFKEYYVYCVQHLQRQTSSLSDAKELYTIAFTKYWIKYRRGELDQIKNPKHYILKIALNLLISQARKRKFEYPTDLDEIEKRQNQKNKYPSEEEYNELIKKESNKLSEKEKQKKRDSLKKAFQKLSPRCKKLLTATLTYNKTNEELRKEFGYISIDVVKSTRYRCNQNLKKLAQEEYNKMSG